MPNQIFEIKEWRLPSLGDLLHRRHHLLLFLLLLLASISLWKKRNLILSFHRKMINPRQINQKLAQNVSTLHSLPLKENVFEGNLSSSEEELLPQSSYQVEQLRSVECFGFAYVNVM